MFRKLLFRRGWFNRQVARCTTCLRPANVEEIDENDMIQGHYVCTTCQQEYSREQLIDMLTALGLIVRPTPLAIIEPIMPTLPPPNIPHLIPDVFNVITFYQNIPNITIVLATMGQRVLDYWNVTMIDANGEIYHVVANGWFVHNIWQYPNNPQVTRGISHTLDTPMTIAFISTSEGLWVTDDLATLEQRIRPELPSGVATFMQLFVNVIRIVFTQDVQNAELYYARIYYADGRQTGTLMYNYFNFYLHPMFSQSDLTEQYVFASPVTLFATYGVISDFSITDDLLSYLLDERVSQQRVNQGLEPR